MGNNTDLTFFTNEQHHTLLDRFKTMLSDVRLFDVLVGYFRATGFYQLADSIEGVEKTRILVGLGIDKETHDAVYYSSAELDLNSHANAKKIFQNNLVAEIEKTEEDEKRLEDGLKRFIKLLQADCAHKDEDKANGGNGKRLEIRAYPSKNIHAKVYIGKFKPDDRDHGFVITGSSNFSYSGLVANREFNVELRNRADVDFSSCQFEELWKDSVDISEDFVDSIQNKTWLNDQITPYELYLKLVYEYMQEDINLNDDIDTFLPEGFMLLKYQQEAVVQALKKLEEYNGVFLADVVGLGKTFIAAQLLQQIKGRILVICPPVLKSYWEESLQDFRVPARVESLGKLEHIIKRGYEKYDYIVIDEAHRFRNEATRSYADLLDICRGKKVVLVTATPLNNTIDDIYAQIKLFQAPKNSTIPGIPNLEKFFSRLRSKFANLDRNSAEYQAVIKDVSKEIRERVLKHIMVRRTRCDVTTYYKKDMEEQNLVFPEIKDPNKIPYQFAGHTETVFSQTTKLLEEFKYARYVPLGYYVGQKKLTEFELQQQRNVGGFMKGILVKRLESSFYAFRKSVDRFITSYERFIEMHDNGVIYISNDVDVYELLDNDDIETLDNLVENEKAAKYKAEDFKDEFANHLEHDLQTLKTIKEIWQTVNDDPKLETFVDVLQKDKTLKNKKLVIFTESKETGDYLFENLNKHFNGEVMFFSSKGGLFGKEGDLVSKQAARELIQNSFDPNQKIQTNDIRILVSTDVLAEGINLHRSNILVNYDLPWNPTRVLQRAGRVNRLGSRFANVHIYNFFPTTQSDEHLGLEANITTKIQMFHSILGEDAKYLTEGEEIGSQELFDTINRKVTYTGENGETDPELMYLEMMRNIRDKQPELFERIKRLPKKARSGRYEQEQKLVTFFRIGKLKKFYVNQYNKSEETTFFEAANMLTCEPLTKRAQIPQDYFHLLETNKQAFDLDTLQATEPDKKIGGSRSNANYVERRLKDKNFRRCPKFTELDEEFISEVLEMLKQGTMAKKVAQTIKKKIEKTLDPLETLHILRKGIRTTAFTRPAQQKNTKNREVILSGYLVNQEDA